MKTTATVREAVESDLPAILTIYNEVIATSTGVYALEPSTMEDRRMWFSSRCASGFPVLVATTSVSNGILGFASFGDWRGARPGIAIPSSIQFTYGMTFAVKAWGAHLWKPCFRERLRSANM
jgi:hypothetical protein